MPTTDGMRSGPGGVARRRRTGRASLVALLWATSAGLACRSADVAVDGRGRRDAARTDTAPAPPARGDAGAATVVAVTAPDGFSGTITSSEPLPPEVLAIAEERLRDLHGQGMQPALRDWVSALHAEGATCADEPACRTACDGGDLMACRRLAERLMLRGLAAEAELVLHATCGRGDGTACFLSETQLPPADPREQHEADYGAACATGDAGKCVLQGVWGARANRGAAAEGPLRTACDAGNAAGCYYLGEVVRRLGRLDEAVPLLRRSCDLGDPVGCRFLGHALDSQGGPAGDVAAAYRASCDGGDPMGCAALQRFAPPGPTTEPSGR